MINIGNNSIENILVGDTLVDRVYLGVDVVWEHSLPSVRNYLKFTALESGTFTLTIPDSVDATCLESVSYSLDNGATWVTTLNTSSDVAITTPTVSEGGTVLWKGSGTQMAVGANANKYSIFSSTGRFAASGNIMSLLYQDTFENELTLSRLFAFAHLFYKCPNITTPPELPATTINSHAYRGMFTDCTSLTIAPELPAMTATYSCYDYMFAGCSSLITAPELPATTLENYCYEKMFDGCSNLKYPPSVIPANSISSYGCIAMFANCNKLLSAPDIYATSFGSHSCELMFNYCSSLTTSPNIHPIVVSERCFNNMFWGCTSLKTAPSILPATTLANGCYRYMFDECKNLENAPELPALTLVSDCYLGMFHNCNKINRIKAMFTTTPSNSYTQNWVQYVASSGTFVKNVEATWDVRGNNGIPTNWTVETAARNYLKFTALESGTFSLRLPPVVNANRMTSVSYSVDNGATWVTTTNDDTDITITTPTIAAGDSVLWKGTGQTMANNRNANNFSNFSSTGSFAASGNIMSLLFENTFEDEKVLPISSYIFAQLFKDCTGMTTPPELPATTMKDMCYDGMFRGCTSLTETPELPALNLARYCYLNMFNGCTSLTTMPYLPAEQLALACYQSMFEGCTNLTQTTELHSASIAISCYQSMFKNCTSLVTAPRIKARSFGTASCREMFYGCTSLTTIPEFVPETIYGNTAFREMFYGCTSLTVAPALPATTLTTECYVYMFRNCTSLIVAPELPATTLTSSCYLGMFQGCTSLTTAPELPATTLPGDGCYSGMFSECTSLTKAPDLPALILTSRCYNVMFLNCTNLNYIKCLATDISANGCVYNWTGRVAANGTFVKNSEMSSWPTGWGGIPSGWTVENVTRNYLKFTALESGTFTLTIPSAVTSSHLTSISYSLDNGETWTTTANDDTDITITTPTVAQGDTVLWRGSGSQTAIGQNSGQYSAFSSTGSFQASGNIMSLLHQDAFENETSLAATYCFCRLFYNCTTITTMPQLPATTLTSNCYREMFYRCSSLVSATKLPATTLQDRCYLGMFNGCSSLTDAPSDMLKFTTTKQYCCYRMFCGCNSLVASPQLLAPTLTNNCYQQMFMLCTSLIRITCLATNISASGCTDDWVQAVGNNGTFVKKSEMTSWSTGRSGIPSGWTVETADD